MSEPLTIFTVGHSTRPIETFLAVLKAHGINCLVDIRSYPQSRRHPHFGQDALEASLASAGIRYLWTKQLGGRRSKKASGASLHLGIRAKAFRAYIEHLATREALEATDQILTLARTWRVALMCAEKNYRRCHRQFLADRLKSLGVKVLHIEDEGPPARHIDHPLLLVQEGNLLYPPKEVELPPGSGAL